MGRKSEIWERARGILEEKKQRNGQEKRKKGKKFGGIEWNFVVVLVESSEWVWSVWNFVGKYSKWMWVGFLCYLTLKKLANHKPVIDMRWKYKSQVHRHFFSSRFSFTLFTFVIMCVHRETTTWSRSRILGNERK